MSACSQNESIENDQNKNEETVKADKYAEPHKYGGWYCPDNLNGFPPVDIRDLSVVPVVEDRLPTREETRNGTSLMFFDTTEFVNVKPLDMDLPRLGKVHNEYNGIDELVIVIQAVVIGKDTVVGYRFPSGGNGSAWYGQVNFLSDKAIADMGSNPFVYQREEVKANTQEIWKAFTSTAYAQQLAERFDQKAFFNSEWTEASRAHLQYEKDNERGMGIISTHFGNLYMHIDYEIDGAHYSEKLLIIEDQEKGSSTLFVVAGPFQDSYVNQQVIWDNWMKEVISGSEKE